MRGKSWIVVGASILVGIFLVLKGIEKGLEMRAPAPPPAVPVAPPAPETETGTGPTSGPTSQLAKRSILPTGTFPYPSETRVPEVSTAPKSCEQLTTFSDVVNAVRSGHADPLAEPLARAVSCRTLASGALSDCDILDAIKFKRGKAGDLCRSTFWDVRVILATAKGDAAASMEACRKGLELPELPDLFGPHLDDACRAETAGLARGNVREACLGMMKFISSGSNPQMAKDAVQYCRTFTTADGRYDCSPKQEGDSSSFAQFQCQARAHSMDALRAGGALPGCGSNEACRAMFSGSPAECVPLESEAVAAYCGIKGKREETDAIAYENGFRTSNGLKKWKKGDPFLSKLPSDQRMKYEKHPKGLKEGRPSVPSASGSDSGGDSGGQQEEPASQ